MQRKETNLTLFVYDTTCHVMMLLVTPILWSTCCLEHVLVRELHLAVEVVQQCRLAKEDELVVDEAI